MPSGLTGYIYDIDDNLTISGEAFDDPLVSFKIEDSCYVNNTFLGTTVAKKITIQLNNINNEINLENKKVKAFAGVEDEYVPFGTFTIQKPENNEVKQTSQVIGYDYMSKFDVEYVDNNTYPIALQDFFENLCIQVGLEAGSTSIVNGNYQVQGNPFTNHETCRTVLSSIAQLAGGFAKIGRDDKVYIVNLQDMPETNNIDTLDGNNYKDDFTKNNMYGEINSLVIALDDDVEGENNFRRDSESIEENGLTEVVISGNFFLINETERNKVIDAIWNVLKGKHYLPFKVTYYGYPWLDSGDNIKVADIKDIVYESYVLNHIFIYNGNFSGTIQTEALTKEQQQYTNENDIAKVFRKVELSVDKINGQITQIIEENSEFSNEISQIIQDIDSINSKISSFTDYTRSQNSTNQIHLEDCAEGLGYIISLTIYGDTNLFNTNEITVAASPYQRGFGVDITLTTEDGQDILTESGDTIIVGQGSYYIGQKTLVLDDKLRNLTIAGTNYYDTLEILQDGTMIITRRIGVNENGELYLLDTYIETVLEEKFVLPSEEEVYYFIEELDGLKYDIDYIIKNDYNELFATKVELNTSITQTAERFEIEVSKKVNEDELCSKISASPDQIILQGNRLIIDSTNFKLDENGDVTLIGQIEDDEGNLLISKDTIYTNLVFTSNPDFLGIGGGYSEPCYLRYLSIYAKIPENFVIKSAYITIRHQPIEWEHVEPNNSNITGYARNIQIYSNAEDPYTSFEPNSGYNSITTMVGIKTKALGENGKTFSSSETETIISTDLSNYLEAGKFIQFDIGSTENANSYDEETEACARCGKAIAQLQVIGYLKFSE